MRIDLDTTDLVKGLNYLERKQFPFAASLALNETAGDMKQSIGVHLERNLDRPTPFTKNGMYIKRSNKSNLMAEVGFKDIQSKYLRWQQEGGSRQPDGRAIVVPVANGFGFRRNKYGNMTRNAVKNALRNKRVFSGQVKGVGGIWLRPKRGRRRDGSMGKSGTVGRTGLQLLAVYTDEANYVSRIHMDDEAFTTAKLKLPSNLAKSFEIALSS